MSHVQDLNPEFRTLGGQPTVSLREKDAYLDLTDSWVRDGSLRLISQACIFTLNFGSTMILARLLSPRDYGLVGMVAAVMNLLAMFKDIGLSTATIQRPTITQKQLSSVFWITLVVSGLVAGLTLLIAPVIARFYGEPKLTMITLALGCGFFFAGVGIQHRALLIRNMQFGRLTIIEISSAILGVIVGILFGWLGAKYWALVLMQLTRSVTMSIGSWLACRWCPTWTLRPKEVRSMLAFGGNLTGFNIINYFARNLDNVLIGKYWGSHQMGLYAKAYQLFLLPLEQLIVPLGSVAIATLSKLADSPDQYKHTYLSIVEKLTILTMPGVAFMIVCSDWIILLILGPQWTGAARIFAILAIAGFTQPVSRTSGWLFITQDRSRQMFHWGLVGGGIAIISILAGLPWGAVGVATSYAVTSLLIRTPLLYWFVGRSGPVSTADLYRVMVPASSASALVVLGLLLVRLLVDPRHMFFNLFLSLLLTAAITFVALLLTSSGRRILRDFRSVIKNCLTRVSFLTPDAVLHNKE